MGEVILLPMALFFFFFFDGLWSDQCILSAFRFPQHYYIDGIQFTIGTVTLQYPSRYSMRALFIGSLQIFIYPVHIYGFTVDGSAVLYSNLNLQVLGRPHKCF